jgi:hypothetical protein
MPTQPQPKQWVVDLTSILDSVAKGAGAILGGTQQNPNAPLPDPNGPTPDPNSPFQVNCPEGYKKNRDGVCEKKGFPILWVGVGIAVIAGTYFLVTKYKNK